MPDLTRILDLLDERTIAQEVGIRNDFARERYQLRRVTVGTIDEFKEEIESYYRWHYAQTIGDTEMPGFMASGLAWEIVDQAYATSGGVKTAFRNAKTGTHGGLSAVLTGIGQHLKKEQEEKYIEWILREHVNPLDFDEITELMRQYLGRFGNFFPPGTEPSSPAELAMNWKELIKIHASVISTMRDRLGKV